MKGKRMKITQEILLSMGAKPSADNKHFVLKEGGHYFNFWPPEKPEDIDWKFFLGDCLINDWISADGYYCITDLEECFYLIAEDMFKAGESYQKQVIREAIGCK
jgi:hypothetical protein